MKIFISLDMEGIAGTYNWQQEITERAAIRKYMTQQVEWVIEGIKKSDSNDLITDITIADSHDGGDNLSYEITELDARMSLISGSPRKCYMMAGINATYDMVFLLGYHCGAGSIYANMDHTYSGRLQNIWINGKKVNETLLNAAYAGYHKVPVALIVGDESLYRELLTGKDMPWISFVVTKSALGRFSAKQKSFCVVKDESIAAVKRVLARDRLRLPCYEVSSPCELKIEFQSTAAADLAEMVPGVTRIDGRNISLTNDDYHKIICALEVFTTLAGTIKA